MANYAFNPRSTTANQFRNQTPSFAQNPFMNELFEEYPQEAFQRWLGMIGGQGSAPIRQDFLRGMFQQYFGDYAQRMFSDPQGQQYPEKSWVEYLASRNPQRDLMSHSPTARREQQSRFARPSRWVAF